MSDTLEIGRIAFSGALRGGPPRRAWLRGSFVILALSALATPSALAAESTKAPAAETTPSKAGPAAQPSGKDGKKASTSTQTTLKGDLTCAKCGLHETTACQNVLRVKDATGQETKYYLSKNAVADSHHEKVCGGSAPATVTGTITEQGGKKIVTATSVKFD